ncbi:hypothetical protein [Dactylosporangium sp. NPDC048998]|uniref:hypothetical protein n=1 Tax=Dactylosporangium sp. NPDC048998 TaxID=3363976 RepID=UPI0037152BB4
MTDRLRDVSIVDAVRTPIGKYGGALAGIRPDDLAAHVVRARAKRAPGQERQAIRVAAGSAS